MREYDLEEILADVVRKLQEIADSRRLSEFCRKHDINYWWTRALLRGASKDPGLHRIDNLAIALDQWYDSARKPEARETSTVLEHTYDGDS
jgi:hypothetical protein